MEYLLPAYTGQFDFPPPPLEAVGSFRKYKRPTTSSFSPIYNMSTETTTDVPDVARHRDADTTAAEETAEGAADAERDARLPRRRRGLGQSRSCSPDDHHGSVAFILT
ncbi:uncharacterized protein BNAC02G11250D [Brassica napus]|uniref:Uncharacterized protein n=2 Tax=Brassica oleracea TaxID=3712 RepID=A0A0D3ALD6_BRAOL|nr:PREDICTED: uncharacterized protein LOC106324728 [Brassica oleracea var. oleracea]XP_013684180.1 uncharacterized protein BNAC02G11250D [Brassica napus]VDD20998.1 unnamed protein product [Brassica oleracea]